MASADRPRLVLDPPAPDDVRRRHCRPARRVCGPRARQRRGPAGRPPPRRHHAAGPDLHARRPSGDLGRGPDDPGRAHRRPVAPALRPRRDAVEPAAPARAAGLGREHGRHAADRDGDLRRPQPCSARRAAARRRTALRRRARRAGAGVAHGVHARRRRLPRLRDPRRAGPAPGAGPGDATDRPALDAGRHRDRRGRHLDAGRADRPGGLRRRAAGIGDRRRDPEGSDVADRAGRGDPGEEPRGRVADGRAARTPRAGRRRDGRARSARRPIVAGVGYGVALLALYGWSTSHSPAFAPLVPSAAETAAALAIAALAAVGGALLARRLADALQPRSGAAAADAALTSPAR